MGNQSCGCYSVDENKLEINDSRKSEREPSRLSFIKEIMESDSPTELRKESVVAIALESNVRIFNLPLLD